LSRTITAAAITYTAIRTPRKSAPFNLGNLIDRLIGHELKDGDILVISSKFVAVSEGRTIDLDTVVASPHALSEAKRLAISPELCELAIRESDEVIGGVTGFMLTVKERLLTPNAGIDKSNIEHGRVVLYPRDPLESALAVADELRFHRGIEVGIVISDSRLMPTRKGTVGVALASSGVDAIVDLRGKHDLFGNILKVTSQAVADDLCSGAQIVMGEANESIPIVLVRGLGRNKNNISGSSKQNNYRTVDFAVEPDQCVYMRSLGYRST
jgi:coenzyme F420-0:L-glutamate ligase/coenzyme F420-1:gamma-L-glutamate ligase